MTHFRPETEKSRTNQASALRHHGDCGTFSDWLSLLVPILMHTKAIDHEGRATGDHETSYRTADRQLDRREDMLEGTYRRLDTGPQSIVGRAHTLAHQGHLNPTLLNEQGRRLTFVRSHPTELLVKGQFVQAVRSKRASNQSPLRPVSSISI